MPIIVGLYPELPGAFPLLARQGLCRRHGLKMLQLVVNEPCLSLAGRAVN